MGVQGLTTYVYSNSDIYLQNFRLKNTVVIIDGNALTAVLYNRSCNAGSAFGGDYDKFARVVLQFFDLLAKCNVTPIVICDGGYEKRKVNTVKKRSLCKVFSLQRITPLSQNVQCFPLMIRHVFKEVLLEKQIDLLQSDFEADSEIAALGRKFDVPVLSNDSDFFIFDVKYIPLATVDFNGFLKDEKGHFYIQCQIFHIDKLLKGLGGMSKTLLPLLATLLGNDYIKATKFKKFYDLLKKDKSKKTSPCGKRVKAVVTWLRNENFQSALAKILGSMRKEHRKSVRRSIENIIKGYTNLNTPLEMFLSSEVKSKLKTSLSDDLLMDFNKIDINANCSESEGDYSDSESEVVEKSCESEDSEIDPRDLDLNDVSLEDKQCIKLLESSDIPLEEGIDHFPAWLLDESRKGNLCPTINTLLSLKTYFFDPQVEDYTLPHAGNISIPILQTLMGCVDIDSITYWSRVRKSYSGTYLSSISQDDDFCENCMKNQLSNFQRSKKLFRTMKIDDPEKLESFPPDWQLYIIAIVYWLKSASEINVRPCYLHAVIITLISVYVIEAKVGVFCQRKHFFKRYGSKLKLLANKTIVNPVSSEGKSIEEIINLVSMDECILAMDELFQYFQVDENLKRRPNEFSRSAIHLFVQLQYSYAFAVTFNSLLLMPVRRSNLSMFYNGTFLYNFTLKLKNCSNIVSYIENLFSKIPIFVSLYKSIYNKMCDMVADLPKQKIKIKKSKSRKRNDVKKIINSQPDSDSACDEEVFNDANNKFSILSKGM